jgi:hypothetical protein
VLRCTDASLLRTLLTRANGFRAQWELFPRHVAGDTASFSWSLEAGPRGVQRAEARPQSWRERRRIDMQDLEF